MDSFLREIKGFEIENSCRTCMKNGCPLRSIFETAIGETSFANVIVRIFTIFLEIVFNLFYFRLQSVASSMKARLMNYPKKFVFVVKNQRLCVGNFMRLF